MTEHLTFPGSIVTLNSDTLKFGILLLRDNGEIAGHIKFDEQATQEKPVIRLDPGSLEIAKPRK